MPIGIVGAIVGASVIGAGASLIASHDASNAASNAAAENNALEGQIYQSNKALETPFINAGDAAENELMGFLGLGGDAQAGQKAFDTFLNSTGYQFALDQGLDSVAQSKAAEGMLGSGSLVKALDAFGTGLADQYGQQYAADLQGVVGTGAGAADALAGQGQSYAGEVSANNNTAAKAAETADYSAANAFNSAIGTSLGALSRGGTSFLAGGAGSFNAFAPIGG